MTILTLLAHAAAHEAPTGGAAAVLGSVAALGATGVALTYIADAPPERVRVHVAGPSTRTDEAWLPGGRRGAGSAGASPTSASHPTDPTPRFTALACAGAGLVHAAVAAEHLGGSLLHGASLALLAIGQLVLAALLLRRPTERLLRAVLATSAWAILLWAISRSTAIVLVTGRQAVGLVDVGAAVLELVVVAGCLTAMTHEHARHGRVVGTAA